MIPRYIRARKIGLQYFYSETQMVDIRPFKGILYNFAKGAAAEALLAPPYDVINRPQRDDLAARHEHNVVNLVLPEGFPEDTEGSNQYSRAAGLWSKWQDEKVLVRDEKPAIYCYKQKFSINGVEHERPGFVALVRVANFEEKVIKPHERIHSGPKQDRLKLIKASRANFSSIFSLYSDPDFVMENAFEAARETPEIFSYSDDDDVVHTLWRLTDVDSINKIRAMLKDKCAYIADGHHRYSTAISYRDYLVEKHSPADKERQCYFTMMYFVNMNNKGMVILPTHRMLRQVPDYSMDELTSRLEPYFSIEALDFNGKDNNEKSAAISQALVERSNGNTVFCLALANEEKGLMLILKDQNVLESFDEFRGKVSASHDVSILQHLVFEKILELPKADIDSQKIIRYKKDIIEGLDKMSDGKYQMGFFINATRIEQVREVADAEEIMPQKSTFFYPKIPSGLVFNTIDPARKVTP